MVKSPTENKLEIYIEVSTVNAHMWRSVQFDLILQLSGSAKSSILSSSVIFDQQFSPKIQKRLLQSASYSPSSYQYLCILLIYNQTLQNQDLTLTLNPMNSGFSVFSSLPQSQIQLNLQSDNNLLINLYSDEYYSLAKTVHTFAQILGIVCFVMAIIGTLFGNMMISLETGFIFQMAYFSVLTAGPLNPMFYALSGLKYSIGYNMPLFNDSPLQESSFLKNIVGIGMYSSIVNNVNISLALVVLCLLIGGIIKLVSRLFIED